VIQEPVSSVVSQLFLRKESYWVIEENYSLRMRKGDRKLTKWDGSRFYNIPYRSLRRRYSLLVPIISALVYVTILVVPGLL
jgi:hypothetical protein